MPGPLVSGSLEHVSEAKSFHGRLATRCAPNTMRARIGLFLLLLLLAPATAHARIGGPDPELIAFLKPSPLYSVIVLPTLVAAVVLLPFLHRRVKGGDTSSAWLVADVCLGVAEGLVLFLLYPRIYAMWFATCDDLPMISSDLPVLFRPPLWTMCKPVGGVLLVLVWLLLQPVSMQVTAQCLMKQDQVKVRTWPLYLFYVCFSLWFVAALFRPLMVLY